MSKIIPVQGYSETYGQADFGEYPWMAVLLSETNNYIGAGALIDNYHVLTAAHKVQDQKLVVNIILHKINFQLAVQR